LTGDQENRKSLIVFGIEGKLSVAAPSFCGHFRAFPLVKNLTTKQQPPIRWVTPQTELNKTCLTNPTA